MRRKILTAFLILTVGIWMFQATADSLIIRWVGDKSANTNVTAGLNSVDSDITLTDPGNGDFTLPDSSAAEGVGLMTSPNTGLKAGVDNNWNIGVDQTDTQAGGGGATGYIAIF